MSYLNWAQTLSASIDFFVYDTLEYDESDGSGSIQTIPADSASRVDSLISIVKDGKSDAESWASSQGRDFTDFELWYKSVENCNSIGNNFYLAHTLVRDIKNIITEQGDITSAHIDTELANL
jgi:hypothetical protein